MGNPISLTLVSPSCFYYFPSISSGELGNTHFNPGVPSVENLLSLTLTTSVPKGPSVPYLTSTPFPSPLPSHCPALKDL